ncbi:MAG: hypothetical protein AAFX50_10470 [Acidobacteriota bacterium]
MTGAIALGLWFLSWVPNHHGLAASIDAADPLEHRLVPWQAIAEPSWPLWLVWHERPVLGAAVFIPDDDWNSTQALLLAGTDRLLPQLSVPRLLLAPEHFQGPDGSLGALEELKPDSAERLLNGLLGASMDRRARSDAAFARDLAARAAVTMADVPRPFQVQAFRAALVDFGAHIFSISHEVGRHQRRRLGRGETLCAVLDHPASLFGLWRRALESGEYFGYRPVSAEGSQTRGFGTGRWVRTRGLLDRGDKDWLLGQLGVEWSGDPAEDFSFLCGDGAPPAGPG